MAVKVHHRELPDQFAIYGPDNRQQRGAKGMRCIVFILANLAGYLMASAGAKAQTIGVKGDFVEMFASQGCEGVFVCHAYFPQNSTGKVIKITHVSCQDFSDHEVIGSALGPMAAVGAVQFIKFAFFDLERSKTASNGIYTYLHATPDILVGAGRFFTVRVGTGTVGDQSINCSATGVLLP